MRHCQFAHEFVYSLGELAPFKSEGRYLTGHRLRELP